MWYLPISEGSFFEQMSLFGISEFPHMAEPLKFGSVSASGTGRIRLESLRPAMPDTEHILTGNAPCPALHFSYKFPGSK